MKTDMEDLIGKWSVEKLELLRKYLSAYLDGLVKSRHKRHPGESRGPELFGITRFRLPPE